MTRPRSLLLALLLPLSLVAAACGDDDDDVDVSDTTTDDADPDGEAAAADDPATDDAATDDAVTADPATDDAATDDAVTADADASDGVVSSGEGVCADAGAVEELVAEFNSESSDIPTRQYFEDLQVVVEDLQAADNGDLADTLDTLHTAMDDLGDIAEQADGNSDAADELLLAYDNEALIDAVLDFVDYAATECGIGEAIGSEPSDVLADIEVGAAADPIDTDDPAFAPLIDNCFNGDGAACDELYFTTPVDSPEEAYGATCGGRIDEPAPGACEQLLGAG